jgi:Kef-type K+ transport system membrane component KefB
MVVGGTLVTDTLALGVLAVIAGSHGRRDRLAFWVRLLGGLALYVAVIYSGCRGSGGGSSATRRASAREFIFLLVVLFACAYLATLAGAQPIIGAFLAGLTLNRLIPNEGRT